MNDFYIVVDTGNGKLHEQGEPKSWRGNRIQDLIFITGMILKFELL